MAKQKYKGLVIVESPAKAKKINSYLGRDYKVLASMGHVRDLPESAADIPEEVKKEPWSRLGVNVSADFEPLYVIPAKKKKLIVWHVKKKRGSSKSEQMSWLPRSPKSAKETRWSLLCKMRLIIFAQAERPTPRLSRFTRLITLPFSNYRN